MLAGCGSAPSPEPLEYPLGPVVAPLETESPRFATPLPGDEILFAETGEAEALLGVVESVGQGDVRFRYRRAGREYRGVLDLHHPDVRRDRRGRILNSYLRIKRRGDPPDTRYLAGELLVGFRAPP